MSTGASAKSSMDASEGALATRSSASPRPSVVHTEGVSEIPVMLVSDLACYNFLQVPVVPDIPLRVYEELILLVNICPFEFLPTAVNTVLTLPADVDKVAVIKRIIKVVETLDEVTFDSLAGIKKSSSAARISESVDQAIEVLRYMFSYKLFTFNKVPTCLVTTQKSYKKIGSSKLADLDAFSVVFVVTILSQTRPSTDIDDVITGNLPDEMYRFCNSILLTPTEWNTLGNDITKIYSKHYEEFPTFNIYDVDFFEVRDTCVEMIESIHEVKKDSEDFLESLDMNSDKFVYLLKTDEEFFGNMSMDADAQKEFENDKSTGLLFDDTELAEEMSELSTIMGQYDMSLKFNPSDFDSFGLMDAKQYAVRFMNLTSELTPTERYAIVVLAVAVTSKPRILKAMEVFADKVKYPWYPRVHEWYNKVAVQYTTELKDEKKSFAVVHIPSCNPTVSANAWKSITHPKDLTVANFLKNRFASQIALSKRLLHQQRMFERNLWNKIKKSKSGHFEKNGFNLEYWMQKSEDKRLLVDVDWNVVEPPSDGYTEKEIAAWIKM